MALPMPPMAYSSPPSFPSSRAASVSAPSSNASMGGNSATSVDGIGSLNYQRALDIARNTEGDLDPSVRDYLEQALTDIWGRIQQHPDSYLLTKDEFAVFNFYIQRFIAYPESEAAIARYWSHASDPTRS